MLKTIAGKMVLVLMATALLLSWTSVAFANAAPPPLVVWFVFDDQSPQKPALQGVQLIGCQTEACSDPLVLQQYGTCSGADCLPAAPTLSGWADTFECASGTCRATSNSYAHVYFRLVAQFSDRTRASRVVGRLPYDYGEELAWRVVVQDNVLLLEETRAPQVSRLHVFWGGLAFSQLVELLVAGACWLLWLKADLRRLINGLVMIFLINLVTFPVVWLFFPSLAQFQPTPNRYAGVLSLAAAIVYAGLLVRVYVSQGRARLGMIVLTVLSLPIAGLCAMMAFVIAAYGNYSVAVQGLSANAILLMSEVFAVVSEAALIALLSRGSLSWRQAALISVLMNAASFLGGRLAFALLLPGSL